MLKACQESLKYFSKIWACLVGSVSILPVSGSFTAWRLARGCAYLPLIISLWAFFGVLFTSCCCFLRAILLSFLLFRASVLVIACLILCTCHLVVFWGADQARCALYLELASWTLGWRCFVVRLLRWCPGHLCRGRTGGFGFAWFGVVFCFVYFSCSFLVVGYSGGLGEVT